MSRFGAFPRTTALRCGCSDVSCLGEGFLPPASLRLVSAGLDQPAQPILILVFISDYLSRLFTSSCLFRRRSSVSQDARRGNVRGSNAYCTLDPSSRSRVPKTPLARARGMRARLPRLIFIYHTTLDTNLAYPLFLLTVIR